MSVGFGVYTYIGTKSKKKQDILNVNDKTKGSILNVSRSKSFICRKMPNYSMVGIYRTIENKILSLFNKWLLNYIIIYNNGYNSGLAAMILISSTCMLSKSF